ncbi:MAG: hypothetical protein CL706_06900 [Chloroflexi bacterium]|nr:hypothetical protein [Chloroflexota bacterium]
MTIMRDSVFTHDILPRIQAHYPVISIVSHEWERIQSNLIAACKELGRDLITWSSASDQLSKYNFTAKEWEMIEESSQNTKISIKFDDIWTSSVPQNGPNWRDGKVGRCAPDVLLWYYDQELDWANSILWIQDLVPYLDSTSHGATAHERRALIRRIRDLCQTGSGLLEENKTIVMSFPESYLPLELEKDVEEFRIPLPNEEYFEKLFAQELKEWNQRNASSIEMPSADIFSQINKASLGLTSQEASASFRQIFARMSSQLRVNLFAEDATVLNEQKAQIINKTGVLEYVSPRESMTDIGGMDNLKDWLKIRRGALDDVRDPPKGLLMMGVPGCGKSLMARAVANDWKLPLLALKANNIFDKYVGESEGKINRALAIAEAMAPCVLWIDEIEKLLAGSGGDGSLDSGVSARMGGAILTWMADKRTPVFVVATANNPERLDPAYVRRGRFDERFFVDLPSVSVRESIIKIHLKDRFPDIEIKKSDYKKLSKASEGFTGAEIESSIVEAKNNARFQGLDMPDAEIILEAINGLTPDSVAMGDTISDIRQLWGGERARKADSSELVDVNSEKLNNVEVRAAVRRNRKVRDLGE